MAKFELTHPPGRVSEPPPSRHQRAAQDDLPETQRAAAWSCRGYMVPHGVRNGRMWFVCSACRWR